MSLNRLVLVLNASYEPINAVPVRRAMVLTYKRKAIEEAWYAACTVRSATKTLRIPSVIRLLEYRRIPRQNRSVSPKGIMLRDRNTCQYCGTVLPARELTLDHVMPSSRGGGNSWENLVAACFPCNNCKRNRTPEEAGMTLLRRPHQLSIHSKHKLLQGDDTTWTPYLFA